MALITKAIKGTKDVLPSESYKNQYIEATCLGVAENFGYKEMRTPVFEHTELFQRGVGDTTDVVQKEMYTFDDKGGRSITLRPEGTAGAARSFLENGLSNEALPQKICYLTSCYRYEKPQTGRLREFHQFGIECFGAASPLADAEMIALAKQIFDELGVKDLHLEINSIGCPKCRAEYHKALKEYFTSRIDELCDTCRDRLDRNPMRILDCKSPVCSEIAKDAPVVLDYLCDECREHFEKTKSYLDASNIEYIVNPQIVRGLDYYTKTVFEFVSDSIGSQGTVCGGGRYDGLMRKMGRRSGGIGFAVYLDALERADEKAGADSGYINVALPKGRLGEKVYSMFERAGFPCPSIKENNRKLIFENAELGLRFFWVKPSDVAIYVERGAADIGVAGKDILLEYEPDVYELLDLKLGICRMAVAGKKDFKDDTSKTLRVATKFSNIARQYYAEKCRDIDIIHLNGSIELAPILGLSDVIVDIVETGKTLLENNLEPFETIVPISARLISNKASFKFKAEKIEKIKKGLLGLTENEQ